MQLRTLPNILSWAIPDFAVDEESPLHQRLAVGHTYRFRMTAKRQLAALPWLAWGALSLLVVLATLLNVLPQDPNAWRGGIATSLLLLAVIVIGIPLYVHVSYAAASEGTSLRLRRLKGGMTCLMIRVNGFQYVYFDPFVQSAKLVHAHPGHGLLAGYAWLELRMADGNIFRFTTLQMPLDVMLYFQPERATDEVPTLYRGHTLPGWHQTETQRVVEQHKRRLVRKSDVQLLAIARARQTHTSELRAAATALLQERGIPLPLPTWPGNRPSLAFRNTGSWRAAA